MDNINDKNDALSKALDTKLSVVNDFRSFLDKYEKGPCTSDKEI